MHLALDAHNLLTDARGIGVYVRAIAREFAARDDLRLTLLFKDWWPQRHRAAVSQILGRTNAALATRVPRDADVLWSPWNGTFFDARCPSVATIHDCAPFVFPASDAGAREREQEPFRRSAQRAARIITISRFSAEEIVRYLAVPRERISVVPHGVDATFTPGTPHDIPPELRAQDYIAVVGASDARKNRGTLVDAWRATRTQTQLALVCVGGENVDGAVNLRDLTVAQLRDIYRGALALAMPSTYEGFGLPALEALACGTPVIASRAASLPEVCGDGALYIDDPLDVTAWADALCRIVADADLRSNLAQHGLQRARGATWRRAADATLEVLRAAATRPPSP